MSRPNAKRGPTREQLTDGQWGSVCRLFETIERIAQRLAAEKRLVKHG